MLLPMRPWFGITAALSLSLLACQEKPAAGPAHAPKAPPSRPNDLSQSVAAAREAFNARSGEARFLTLLSPT